MNYKKLGKSLLNPKINVLTELSIYPQLINTSENGYLYTFYNHLEKKMLMGYTSSLYDIKNNYSQSKYSLIDSRLGKINELNILQSTLLELGFNQEYQSYTYSRSLIKYLTILNWPIGSLNNKFKVQKRY